jgi:polysaccharide export outer membrane protein
MDLDTARAEKRGRTSTGIKEFSVQRIDPFLLEQLERQAARMSVQAPSDPYAEEAATYQYTIAPFDVLAVTVWDHPELTTPASQYRSSEENGNPVQADGTVYYPHVGVVPVAGKTVAEVRAILTERLKRVIQNPQLDVRVAAYRGKRVQVTGMVLQPTTVSIMDVPLRVQDAIAAAKGFAPEADWSDVTLTRADGSVQKLDLLALYERGDFSQNWLLKAGDVVNVGDRTRNRVFVIGEVRRQQARVMTNRRMTLAEAIGDADGIDLVTANPAKIYVIRGAFEAPLIYHLDASSPDALLLATAFQLKPRDVVLVSAYELSRWNRVMSQILPTIQGLWQTVDLTTHIQTPR